MTNSDFYINSTRKIIDFLIGFIGLPVVIWFLIVSFNTLGSMFYWFGDIAPLLVLALVVAGVVGLVLLNPKRSYIVTGAVMVIVVPIFLMFGYCAIAGLTSNFR